MIEIDGSYGEGGGQILRSSLSLSAVTGLPVRVFKVRAGRKDPGLKPQHLMGTRAVAAICSGRLEGAELGSTEVILYPGPVGGGDYAFDVSEQKASAGSSTLILQTVLWPLGFAPNPSQVEIRGGTHVPWSPPAEYISDVFGTAVSRMGVFFKPEIARRGFYPMGGGIFRMTIEPFQLPLAPLQLGFRGGLRRIRVISHVSNLPLSIAERQLGQVRSRLQGKGLSAEGEPASVEAPGKGTFCMILAEFENVRTGFSALGAIGKPAEKVADEATDQFLHYLASEGTLDPHLADQLVLPMALAAGRSDVTLSKATAHLKTNLWAVSRFLQIQINLETPAGPGPIRLRIDGTGLQKHGNRSRGQ